jgi:hypothetical protein
MLSIAVSLSRSTSLSISVLSLVAIMICRKSPSAAGIPLLHNDQIAMATKKAPAARQMLYGSIKLSGLAKGLAKG